MAEAEAGTEAGVTVGVATEAVAMAAVEMAVAAMAVGVVTTVVCRAMAAGRVAETVIPLGRASQGIQEESRRNTTTGMTASIELFVQAWSPMERSHSHMGS